MPERRCSRCRFAVEDIAAFCPRCGGSISTRGAATAPVAARPVADRRINPVYLGGIALVLGGILFGFLFVSHGRYIPAPIQINGSFPAMTGADHSTMSIRDEKGQEITDPALRAQIESAIKSNSQNRP